MHKLCRKKLSFQKYDQVLLKNTMVLIAAGWARTTALVAKRGEGGGVARAGHWRQASECQWQPGGRVRR